MIRPPASVCGPENFLAESHPSTAPQHGSLLHGSRPGHVAVATRFPGDQWREKAYPVGDLPEVLEFYAGQPNVYLSTQRFFWWRRLTRLRELGALSADVDFYKRPALRNSHPLGALEDCLVALERASKPRPSLAIASGQGLALLWLHSPVPRQALPRWNACQKELWRILSPLGADRQALDAARVLRVVGSRHGGTGAVVEALTPAGEVWDFDDLADEVLPLDRIPDAIQRHLAGFTPARPGAVLSGGAR